MNIFWLVLEIIADIALVLYAWSTLMAYNKVKDVFTCKKCNKLNSAIHKHCDFCGKDMKPWVGIYVTFLRIRVNCRNKDGFPELKKAKKYVIIDLVIISICVLLVSFLLAQNITARL